MLASLDLRWNAPDDRYAGYPGEMQDASTQGFLFKRLAG